MFVSAIGSWSNAASDRENSQAVWAMNVQYDHTNSGSYNTMETFQTTQKARVV